jgi:hypothetical protein
VTVVPPIRWIQMNKPSRRTKIDIKEPNYVILALMSRRNNDECSIPQKEKLHIRMAYKPTSWLCRQKSIAFSVKSQLYNQGGTIGTIWIKEKQCNGDQSTNKQSRKCHEAFQLNENKKRRPAAMNIESYHRILCRMCLNQSW